MFQRHLMIGAAAAVVLAAPALAEEVKVSGMQAFTPISAETTQLPNGNVMTRVHTRGVQLTNDTTSLHHGMSQDCYGVMIATAEGEFVSQSGACDMVDQDGDGYGISWQNADDGSSTFSYIWGTGKFAGITGGGTSINFPVTPDGRFSNKWEATYEMK